MHFAASAYEGSTFIATHFIRNFCGMKHHMIALHSPCIFYERNSHEFSISEDHFSVMEDFPLSDDQQMYADESTEEKSNSEDTRENNFCGNRPQWVGGALGINKAFWNKLVCVCSHECSFSTVSEMHVVVSDQNDYKSDKCSWPQRAKTGQSLFLQKSCFQCTPERCFKCVLDSPASLKAF